MQQTWSKRIQTIALILGALLAGLIFVQSPGTTDVDIWRTWINHALARGVVDGFAANQADYPPLATAILYGATRIFDLYGLSVFIAIKLSILFFLWLTSFFFWLWTRDVKVTLILYFALLLNSVALGYIDIYFAPTLILGLWMLKERRYFWFAALYTLTCLIKWQPILIAPFIAVYLLGVPDVKSWGERLVRRIGLQTLLPAGGLVAAALVAFGVQPVWQAFQASLEHKFLSGNALNLNWIITYYLQVTRPNDFGGLQNGMANYILTEDRSITLVPRLLFYATYAVTLLVFLFREKSLKSLLIFATVGFMCYYAFNTGVHENHLFLVAILATVLFWLDESLRPMALLLILIDNVNLFLFYGVDGVVHFDRTVLGLDISLPLAIFNVGYVVFLLVWGTDNGFREQIERI
jgi:hypothetical protein